MYVIYYKNGTTWAPLVINAHERHMLSLMTMMSNESIFMVPGTEE